MANIEDRWRARAEEIAADWTVTEPMLRLGEEMAREAREEAERLKSERDAARDVAARMIDERRALRARLAAAESALASARDKAIEECASMCEQGSQIGVDAGGRTALLAMAECIRSLRAERPAEEQDQPGAETRGPGTARSVASAGPPPAVPFAAPPLDLRFSAPPGPDSEFVEAEVAGAGVRVGEWVQDGAYWILRISRESFDRVVPASPPPKADGAEPRYAAFATEVLANIGEDHEPGDHGAIAGLAQRWFGDARAQGRAEGRREALDMLASKLGEIGAQMRVEIQSAALSRPSAPARAEKERGA